MTARKPICVLAIWQGARSSPRSVQCLIDDLRTREVADVGFDTLRTVDRRATRLDGPNHRDYRPSSLHHPTLAGLDGLDDHGSGNTILMVEGDRPPHDLDDLVREQRHQGGILDPERPVPADPHAHEPGSFKLLGEDTLRQ